MMITGSLQKFKIFFSFLARVGSQDADSGVLETIDASLENIMEPEKKALKKKISQFLPEKVHTKET